MVSLEISDSTLRCLNGKRENSSSIDQGMIWSVEIKDLALIAEYTTSEGPYLDDYFLVFVSVENGRAYNSRCTFYADGRDEALQALGTRLGADLRLGLFNSTEWTSRVVWPAHLQGDEYFHFTQVKPVGLLSTMSKAWFGPQLEYSVADPVRAYIREASSQAGRYGISSGLDSAEKIPQGLKPTNH